MQRRLMDMTPEVFYEQKTVWRSDGDVQRTRRLTATTHDGARVAVVEIEPSRLHCISIPTLNTGVVEEAPIQQSCVSLFLEGLDGEEVVWMTWSRNGTTLGVGSREGRLLLLSSMGVVMHVMDLGSWMKKLSSFVFLTESVVLVATAEGKVMTLNVHSPESMQQVVSVGKFHQWPQLAVRTERGMCVMGGVSYGNEWNVTVWKFNADFDTWVLMYACKEPVSGFRTWWKGVPPRSGMFTIDFSDDSRTHVISGDVKPPLVLKHRNEQIEEMAFDGEIGDVLQTVSGAVFWNDTTLAMTTDIGKILFVNVDDRNARLLASEDVPENTMLIGRYGEGGVLCLVGESSPEKTDMQLVVFRKQTASEHRDALIAKRDFEAALKVSELTELPTGAVYKEMWNSRDSVFVRFSELEEFHSRIEDVDWVIQTCCEVTGASFLDQRRLLEYGLDLCEPKVRERPREGQLATWYMSLVRLLELLHTFEALHPGCYSPGAFEAFKCSDLQETAQQLARSGNIRALQVLLKQHSHALLIKMPMILRSLPCNLPPREYSSILPSMDSMPGVMECSPALSGEVRDRIADTLSCIGDLKCVGTLPDVVLAQCRSKEATKKPVFSQTELTDLYLSMARHAETETGNVKYSKSLLEYGIQKGVCEGLDEELKNLSVFENWLTAGTSFWNFTSEFFSQLSMQQRIEHLLQHIPSDAFHESVETILAPLSKRLPIEEATNFRQMLLQYALRQSSRCFEELVSSECVDSGLFGVSQDGFNEFATAVIAVIESVDKITDWDAVYEALDMLSRQGTMPQTPSTAPSVTLAELLEDCHLGSLLEKRGLRISYSQLRKLTASDGERLVKSVLGHGMRSGTNWSEAQWDELLSDLMTISLRLSHLSNSAFDVEAVKLEYFQTLLRASQFTLADSYMSDNLDLDRAEEIVWKVGREMLCALMDLENFSMVDEVRRCFDLFPSSQRAQNEIRKIKGLTSVRSHFGVVLLPMEVEQFTSQSELIERILAKSEKHYKKREALSSLCADLQFSDVDFFTSWQILCKTALRHNDVHKANELLRDLRDRNMTQSWELARELLNVDRSQGYLSAYDKQEMWAYVITHCNAQLQECIEEMSECTSSPESTKTSDMKWERGGLSWHEDVFRYLADASYKAQLKLTEYPLAEQRRSLYDFVHDALESINNTDSETSAFVRSLLETTPHAMLERLKESPQFLHPGKESEQAIGALEQHLTALHAQDQLQSSCQRIQTILPGLDVMKFSSAGGVEYRKQITLELADYAGELLFKESRIGGPKQEQDLKWQNVLSIALEQGREFGVQTWTLRCHFVCTLCGLVDRELGTIEEAVVSIEEELLQDRVSYIKEVLERSWNEVSNAYGVSFVLRILCRCIDDQSTGLIPFATTLLEYASKITEMDIEHPDFDFRIPIQRIVSSFMSKGFGVQFDWISGVSELQNVYFSIDATNYGDIADIYTVLDRSVFAAEEVSTVPVPVSTSTVHLAVIVKELLGELGDAPLSNADCWKQLMSHMSEDDVKSLINFAVFIEIDCLLATFDSVEQRTKLQIRSWKSSTVEEGQRLRILKLLLEEGITRLEGSERPDASSLVERWRGELKRMRRVHAAQDLSGLGVHVTGDDFNENVKSLIRDMILTDSGYVSIFVAVERYAERSDEDTDRSTLEQCISGTVLECTKECVSENTGGRFQKIISCLDASEPPAALSQLQEGIWRDVLLTLRAIVHNEEGTDRSDVVSELASVVMGDRWSNRPWSISVEDRWLLFSLASFFQLVSVLSECPVTLKPDGICSLDRVQSFLDSLIASNCATSLVCSILDVLRVEQKLLDTEVETRWLSTYYSKAFHKDLERGDPVPVLKYLCEQRTKAERGQYPLLDATESDDLFSAFQRISQNLAFSFGMLAGSSAVQTECVNCVATLNGNANTLVVLLQTSSEMDLHDLIEDSSWLRILLSRCPPCISLTDVWKNMDVDDKDPVHDEQSAPQSVEKDIVSPSGSGDGWDIDDDLVFEEESKETAEKEEEIALGGSGGWSDVDELEAALQSAPEGEVDEAFEGDHPGASSSIEPAQSDSIPAEAAVQRSPIIHPQDALDEEDAMFIAACCFPTVLSLLVLQGHVYHAAQLLAEKVNFHPESDVLTGGRVLLRKFFARMMDVVSEEKSDRFKGVLDGQWTRALLLDLFTKLPPLSERALSLLKSHD